ncbi:MAG: ribonuclease III [Alphaproteobacteria bacterium]|nr:ribonuclease III [Alphaproteobacteria bacterium]
MDKLQKIIDYQFKDDSLLQQATTHGSYVADLHKNYERLEFLGDRVLGLCVSKMLYKLFPEEEEGKLSQRYVGLVCKETVSAVALELGFDKYIVVANEEIRTNENVMCDVCEAIIGAIFIDGGYDEAVKFVRAHWRGLIDRNIEPPKDAKTTLQETAHLKSLGNPVYALVSREGSEHEPIFHMSVRLSNLPVQTGSGKNKKLAEQEAAAKMLSVIGGKHGK